MTGGLVKKVIEPEDTSTRIWRLQYGPCWCQSAPAESAAFDFVRLRRTPADFGSLSESILIVSERVIDGTASVYRQVHSTIPDPKLVVAAGTCPTSGRFWDDLPNGWVDVGEVLPVDVRVDDCVSGRPEALLAALLGHLFAARHRQASVRTAEPETAAMTPALQTHHA